MATENYRVVYERTITEQLVIDVIAHGPDDAVAKTYNDGLFQKQAEWNVTKPGTITPVASVRLDILGALGR